MLPTSDKNEWPQPRWGARTVQMLNVRRNVRMYSPDLVKTCASWVNRPRGVASSAGERAFAGLLISPPHRISDEPVHREASGPRTHGV